MSATRLDLSASATAVPAPTWSFLTNYALVLAYVVLHPDSTVRTTSMGIGITERATLAILRDLDDERIVLRSRNGRRNTYAVNFSRLSLMGRGGVTAEQPSRAMVDDVIRMLFASAPRESTASHRAPEQASPDAMDPRVGTWEFFTNHLQVLMAAARSGTQTVRELADAAGITERATVAILNQLEAERIINRKREGRRNSYTIDVEAFRGFRGWSFATWRIPDQLVNVAAFGIAALASASASNGDTRR